MADGRNTKIFGFGIILLSFVLFFTLYTITKNIQVLNAELHKNCPLPPGVCPYTKSVPTELTIGFLITTLMFGSGAYLVLMERGVERTITEKKHRFTKAVKTLEQDEKKIYDMIVNSDGFIFQNELKEKLGFSKVKVTRLLDKLEGKGLVERRRRGMSNAVVLKH